MSLRPARDFPIRLLDLAVAVPPLLPGDRASLARKRFLASVALLGLPVADQQRAFGVVLRETMLGLDVRDDRTCAELVDARPLCIDGAVSCRDAARRLAQVDAATFQLPLLVTQDDRYLGMCSAQDVLAAMGEELLESERQPQHLTGLSGASLLELQIARLLREGRAFAAALIDIRGLSVYNRLFGYERGDNLIRYTALLISAFADTSQELVADPGGGRFMLILFGDDWHLRLERMLAQFNSGIAAFVSAEDHARSGYSSIGRDRREHFHQLPALAVGVVNIAAHPYSSPAEVMEAMLAATREAKKDANSAIFVERRAPVAAARTSYGEVPRQVIDRDIAAPSAAPTDFPPSEKSP